MTRTSTTRARPAAGTDIKIVKVLGFFVDSMQGNDVVGRLMAYPAPARRHQQSRPRSAFVVSIALVR